MKRVGFVINSRVPRMASLRMGMPPQGLLLGWDDRTSPMSFMRFHWIADELRKSRAALYSIYQPWRSYDAVVFLKSMGPGCEALAEHLRGRGTRIVFEANVDYYTEFEGEARMDLMAPGGEQRAAAARMTSGADAVIASSNRLAEVCARFQSRCATVPDNVNLDLRPVGGRGEAFANGRLNVWWSGVAVKLFEFLAAERAFLRLADRVHLHLVTDSPDAMRQWRPEVRERFDAFLKRVPHTVHPFRGIPDLLSHYARGGVIVSPRYLDVPYNLSHTEWKITLGMACGLPAVASPVPSYLEAAQAAGEGAVTICGNEDEWEAALEGCLANPEGLRESGARAAEVVERVYSTPVVAERHLRTLADLAVLA